MRYGLRVVVNHNVIAIVRKDQRARSAATEEVVFTPLVRVDTCLAVSDEYDRQI